MSRGLDVAAALEELGHLWPQHDGPAHIVVADRNLSDSDLRWCISQIDEGVYYTDRPFPGPSVAATRGVLDWMLTHTSEEDRLSFAEFGIRFEEDAS